MRKEVIFLCGTTVGGVVGFLAARYKYLAYAKKEIREMEEYCSKLDRYARGRSEVEVKTDISDGDERCDKEIVRELRREQNQRNVSRTDYTKYSKKYDGGDNEEKEPYEDNDLKVDESEEGFDARSGESEIDEEAEEYHQQHFGFKPKIISETALGGIPTHYDHVCLTYYPEEDSMHDEDGFEVENYQLLVGDCLEEYNWRENEGQPDLIFVLNFELDTVYEVTREFDAD